jgi:uncharacterized lipoprotein NlpE involved in copper resistance
MKLLFLPALLAFIFAAGCKPAGTSDQSASPADAHTSANSLTVAGLYTGTVPCADCAGIETTLTLSDGMVYTINRKYLGKDPELVTQHSGKYKWNDAGNTIILDGLDPAAEPTQYLVEEGRIIQLDLAGNRITGELADKYILIQQ